jgi:hypothetical protein
MRKSVTGKKSSTTGKPRKSKAEKDEHEKKKKEMLTSKGMDEFAGKAVKKKKKKGTAQPAPEVDEDAKKVLTINPNVLVIARFRPLLSEEAGKKKSVVAKAVVDTQSIKLSSKRTGKMHTFTQNLILDKKSTQSDLYNAAAEATIQGVFEGKNGVILCTGFTGSGKTYCLFGDGMLRGQADKAGPHGGIAGRATEQILSVAHEGIKAGVVRVLCSYLEIYNEQVNDLLVAAKKGEGSGLKVKEDPNKGMFVDGLTQTQIQHAEEAHVLLEHGAQARHRLDSRDKRHAARSHCIFTISIEQNVHASSWHTSKLDLVELCGSEKLNAQTEGLSTKEAKVLQLSMSSLSNCIKALGKGLDKKDDKKKGAASKDDKGVVPFGASKLTKLLQSSLSGSARISVIACLMPHGIDAAIKTLSFTTDLQHVMPLRSVDQESPEMMQLKFERMQKEVLELRKITIKQQQAIKGVAVAVEPEVDEEEEGEEEEDEEDEFTNGDVVEVDLGEELGFSLGTVQNNRNEDGTYTVEVEGGEGILDFPAHKVYEPSELFEEWEPAYDEGSNKTYYFNVNTDATTWEREEAGVPHKKKISQATKKKKKKGKKVGAVLG